MFTLAGIEKPPRGKLPLKLVSSPVLQFLYPSALRQSDSRTSLSSSLRRSNSSQCRAQSPPSKMENWFIDSLVRAGHCQLHSPRRKSKPISNLDFGRQKRLASTAHAHAVLNTPKPPFHPLGSREELLALAGIDAKDMDMSPPLIRRQASKPSKRNENTQRKPNSVAGVNESGSEKAASGERGYGPLSLDQRAVLERFTEQCSMTNPEVDELYALYQCLPSPRIPYLEDETRHLFLRHLAGKKKRRTEHSMLRYFSVLDDMHATDIPARKDEWTTAIAFTAQHVTKITETEVASVLQLWKKMETEAGVKSDHATFNLLYNTATKAGKLRLADVILEEMQKRRHGNDRYHFVDAMYNRAKERDVAGLRIAFKRLVDSGYDIDILVLNCLITCLLRVGEPSTAHQVYQKLKQVHLSRMRWKAALEKRKAIDPLMWHLNDEYLAKGQKADPLNTILEHFGEASEFNAEHRHLDLALETRTYYILIRHFALVEGDITTTSALLDDMRLLNIPPGGPIFLVIFKAFAIHGSRGYTEWTYRRFESIWDSFMQAVDDERSDVHITRWSAIWALRAVQATSDTGLVMQAWVELRSKWHPSMDEVNFVVQGVSSLLRASKGNW